MTPDVVVTREAYLAADAEPTAIARADAILRVEGPGARDCLQGIFTNDLVKGAADGLRWGAVLTPKGMIVTDLWIGSEASGHWLIVPEGGRDALRALLARSFPPRLAKVTDRSGDLAAWWLTGPPQDVPAAAIALRSLGPAPFAAIALVPREMEPTGWRTAAAGVAAARQLAGGWPVLGREIDEKTLPQEVRFDELDGVRYDKGCYVGQETVARLHFRGHANRTLRALTGRGTPPADGTITTAGGKEVGTVATLGVIGDRWIASAKLRREVATGDMVKVGGTGAPVADFPVAIDAATA